MTPSRTIAQLTMRLVDSQPEQSQSDVRRSATTRLRALKSAARKMSRKHLRLYENPESREQWMDNLLRNERPMRMSLRANQVLDLISYILLPPYWFHPYVCRPSKPPAYDCEEKGHIETSPMEQTPSHWLDSTHATCPYGHFLPNKGFPRWVLPSLAKHWRPDHNETLEGHKVWRSCNDRAAEKMLRGVLFWQRAGLQITTTTLTHLREGQPAS